MYTLRRAKTDLRTGKPINLFWIEATPIKQQNQWLNVDAYLARNASALKQAPKLATHNVRQKQE